MAVTKQTYTANNIWTASQFANLFRSAFIDAGLMSEWYDSFNANGVEQRILEVVYNSGTVYGKTYYWFIFSTTEVRYLFTTGWNATTHVPTGTLYLDYAVSNASTAAFFTSLRTSLSNSIPIQVIRYTSQASPSHSWFLVGQTNSFAQFLISNNLHAPVSWVDTSRVNFSHLIRLRVATAGNAAGVTFGSIGGVRRSAVVGQMLEGNTTVQYDYNSVWYSTASYCAVGRVSGAQNAYNNSGQGSFPIGTSNTFVINGNGMSVILPTYSSSANPAFSSNYNPVCYGIPYSVYVPNSTLPSDFGIIPHYANNTMQQLDTFVVTAGVEEWEILGVANGSGTSGQASIALAARVI